MIAKKLICVCHLYRLGLLAPHWECQVVGSAIQLPCSQFGENGFHVLERAAHPFQFGVLEALAFQSITDIVVGKDGWRRNSPLFANEPIHVECAEHRVDFYPVGPVAPI